jgi:hypothetical protein
MRANRLEGGGWGKEKKRRRKEKKRKPKCQNPNERVAKQLKK